MKTSIYLLVAILASACSREHGAGEWKLLQKKDNLTVSFLPNSVRLNDTYTEGWVRASYATEQAGSSESAFAKYDSEINRWRVNCGRAEYAVVKRVFFLKGKEVAEWPEDGRDEFEQAVGMATPGSRSALVVDAFCG